MKMRVLPPLCKTRGLGAQLESYNAKGWPAQGIYIYLVYRHSAHFCNLPSFKTIILPGHPSTPMMNLSDPTLGIISLDVYLGVGIVSILLSTFFVAIRLWNTWGKEKKFLIEECTFINALPRLICA